MINFGAANITWESINQLTNYDFENWIGNNANNWTLSGTGNPILERNNSVKYTNNSSACLYAGNNTGNYSTLQQNFHNTKGISYWRNKTLTLRGYVLASTNGTSRLVISDGNATIGSSNHTGDNNWALLSISNNISANASEVKVYPYVVSSNNMIRSCYIDTLNAVEGPYTLGKTFGGGSIELFQHSYTGLRTKNKTSIVYGGTGVIHMFQWNNSVPITSNSTIFDYGKLTIASNQITITVDCAKIALGASHAFGTYSQRPFDLVFKFKKSPDTGNVITIS